jgi:hypothetical protein
MKVKIFILDSIIRLTISWINHTMLNVIRKRNQFDAYIDNYKAWEFANTRKGYWRISNSPVLASTLTNKFFNSLGYLSFTERYAQVTNS